MKLFILTFLTAMMGIQGYAVESQTDIQDRVAKHQPALVDFIKDRPIAGYPLEVTEFGLLPSVIRDNLGAVDDTEYSEEYLSANQGTIIALQMNGTDPDFYIVGRGTFESKYQVVPFEEFREKNRKTHDLLLDVPGIDELVERGEVIAALKTSPVSMVVMSEIGYGMEDEVTIESPWGEQTKPSGADGFLVFDASKDMYYMVNADPEGLPIGYVQL